MTSTSIPLDDLGGSNGGDGARRDRWGRYLCLPPGETKLVPHTRSTTVSGALDNGRGLLAWNAAMAIYGVIRQRGLRSQWEALMAENGGDPWYAGPDAKKACKALVEECAKVGGAHSRRDTGTSLHRITALHDAGRPLGQLTDETRRDLDVYEKTLADAGISIVDGFIERLVVLDEFKVAGTFDRLVTIPGFSLPLIADLKCGASVEYSMQSFAVQLASYANGSALYVQGAADDGSEDQRLAMPAVDKSRGLIIHLDAGAGSCELYLLDLVQGWEAFEHSLFARRWRDADVATPYEPPEPGLFEQLQESVAHLAGQASLYEQLDELDALKAMGELRAWLQGRIDAIGKHDAARIDLGHSWPAGLPGLLKSDTHTRQQLEQISAVLWAVEKRHGLAFPPDPSKEVALINKYFPGCTDITQGD